VGDDDGDAVEDTEHRIEMTMTRLGTTTMTMLWKIVNIMTYIYSR
jgi:hypothetical protein